MKERVCMVTGASSGIGRATALGLSKTGARVIMVCRDPERGEQARRSIQNESGNAAVDLLVADLSSQQAIRRLVQEFQARYTSLDILVNNAGSFFAKRSVSVDGIEMTFAVNYLAAFLLTNLLLETLRASGSARIVNVASMHQAHTLALNDLQSEQAYSKMRVYGQAKLAVVLFTYELARLLADSSVTANCLHPGVAATHMVDQNTPAFARPLTGLVKRFLLTPEQGAQTSLYLATSSEVAGVTGKYFVRCQEQPSVPLSYDLSLQERLWHESAMLTNLPTEVPFGARDLR